MAFATIVDGDRRCIDLVVIFRYELDVGRELDRLRRFERLIEFPKQFFLTLFAIVLLALTSSSSFLMAARGSANTFVCGSIAAITKEILAATASYSAKFLNPCFLVTALSSASYLALGWFENTEPCIFSATADMSR